ncbi:type I restriction enzyme M protein [Mucilaginibacter pineti]|uniref:site-specific DNA-methyltransferase (adenine-specific) n=1 Tax=Mucilaginibacter pineti TaxID=1391627 RepID=A0A1G7NKH5_9SPHI|nr:class I SAM-dependent DNA methyltransferase [Mucilaginibacter pineti]SDF73789.1 type I restriction enzyme M protein [Mucilaginibacter pineti]
MDLTGKLWGFCNKLRHDGVDASDYIEQLTYLLFLKMAQEKGVAVPKGYDWQSLITLDEDESLLLKLESILEKLKAEDGILGDIFSEPVSRVKNAKILKGLIKEINSIQWTSFDRDIVGLTFEELIGKVANEGKKGAGQYFTPRPLIQAIVNVMKPNPLENESFNIGDVAVGTGGFLIAANEWFKETTKQSKVKSKDLKRVQNDTYFGQELVQRPRRLALMNMFLHDINASIKLGDTIYGTNDNVNYSCVLTNPPFGTKGASQIPDRAFPIKTSDKQLNFVQHIIEKLKPGGRAAIVLPDSCLSSDPAKKMWSFYLNEINAEDSCCNLHTILKLPDGVFAAYANGIKACVVFLQKSRQTEQTWIYDLRKDFPRITTKSNILALEHFADFEQAYGLDPNGLSKRETSERFKSFTIDEIVKKNYDLSFVEIFTQELLPHPNILIDEMIKDYQDKIDALQKLKLNLSE